MAKKGIIAGGIVAAVIIAIVAAYASQPAAETMNLDMSRTHGSVSTAMGSPILGDPDAPITIVEFGDYQCHQCFNWFHNTKPAIMQDYIDTGKANLVFVDFAMLGRDSPVAAQATYCAEEQGAYWAYHDLLYNSQQGIDDGWANAERLQAFAFSLELDMDLFDRCLESGKYQKRVQNNLGEARTQGATGTPTFVIVGPNGAEQKIGGAQPYSVFKSVIESMI
jgi:protein-disulfide isomerase